ncbi:hypothetical protein [uncultured Erythrobacter sp.]|uniref:hypothetical protein n=1 Tax=uncultured Erythrobacter sp. TaxID=263913 RepID=UPI00261D541A|nr:hypothetical protein [uncultured Erythrobacter sp.]
MFDPKSRYANLPNRTYTREDGSEDIYKSRRILPVADSSQGAVAPGFELVVSPDQRLDTIAANELGDPLAYWHVADANCAMNPFALTLPGTRLRFPGTSHTDTAKRHRQEPEQ